MAVGQTLDTKAVTQVVQSAHAQGNFDGVVLLSQAGKPILSIAVGLSNRAAKTPMRTDTVFRLASLTKQVTALLVMQQVAAGHISLDQRAGELMPTLPGSTARVTIRQLLQHTSGLANPNDGPGGKPLPDDLVPSFYLRTGPDAADNTLAALGPCSAAPRRVPGDSFEYNNCDYIVLGAVLEALTHQPYATLVRKTIIGPLGLKSWGLFPADPKLAPQTALAYKENGTPDDFQNPATYGAAGALYGNALDLAQWDEALLNHKLLSPELTDLMFRADPKLYGEALGSWSYDFKADGTAAPVHIVERQGDIGSTRLLNLLLPGRNASIVILANTDRVDLFNTYARKGIAYEILKAALTSPATN